MPETARRLDRQGRARRASRRRRARTSHRRPTGGSRRSPPTERPRSLTLGADGRTGVFIQDRDTSDVWLLDLGRRRRAPAAHRPGASSRPYWEDTAAAPLARRLHGRLRRRRPRLARLHRRRRRRAGWSRRGRPVWLDDDRSRLGRARRRDPRSRSSTVADAWPQRLAPRPRRARATRRRGGAAVSPDGARSPSSFAPRADLNRSRDPRRRRRDRRGARAHRARPACTTTARRGRRTARTIAYALRAQRLVRDPPRRAATAATTASSPTTTPTSPSTLAARTARASSRSAAGATASTS